MIDDISLSDFQGDYSYLRNLSFELSLIQHFDNKIQGTGFPVLLTKIEIYCAKFSKVLKSFQTTDGEKNGELMSTPSKSEKSLSADLLSPMLSLFTWGDQAEEFKEAGAQFLRNFSSHLLITKTIKFIIYLMLLISAICALCVMMFCQDLILGCGLRVVQSLQK
jgi:hypothetical protein